jgi:hypothetical protein
VQCTGFWCGVFCGLFLVTSDLAAAAWMVPSFRGFINLLLMLFCCGVGGSFAAMLGDVLFETLYFTKENAARRLNAEEHHRHHDEPVNEETENSEPVNEDLEFSPEEPNELEDDFDGALVDFKR